MGTRESKMMSSSISGLAASSSTLTASASRLANDRLAPSTKSIYYCDHDKGAIWSDLLTTDLLEYIPDHWSQFEPPSSCTNLLLAILYFLIFVFGCGGNGLVIVLYLKNKKLRSPSNLLLFNLAIADFFMIFKTPVFIYNSVKCGPALGSLGCDVYGFLGGLTGCGAIFSVAIASIDRYNVISNPLNPRRLTTVTSTLAVLFIWAYSAFFATLPLLQIFNRYTYEGFLTSCTVDYLAEETSVRAFVFCYFAAAWCVPVTIIVCSYYGIYKAVGASEKSLRKIEDTTGGTSGKDKGKNSQKEEIKIAKTAAVLISLWLVSWTPYAAIALTGATGNGALLNPGWSMIPALTAKIAATVDPFVYSLSHPKFKKEIEAMFGSKSQGKGAANKAPADDTATVDTKY
ncbi:opsin, ultraviolet-sensitive-like [Tetranychus urticae]|uniref:opsin, ultraviolet-sensitive-like n=1 Tax=Tetranychus urticae TaxID=32264 RepID=UPI00077BCA0F|nr:opsin, ultraviolet-sensitive-like [Tetranychus urticae]